MEVIRLTTEDCALLEIRFTEHDNSQRRLEATVEEGGEHDAALLPRVRALRTLEHRFTIDLGSLYHRFQRREEPTLHPLERSILESIACWRMVDGGGVELWIFVDRVRQLRQFMDEDRLHWLEPASGEAL